MSTLTSLVDEKASKLAEQVDGVTKGTADGLYATASTIRKAGLQGSQRIEDLAKTTAKTFEDAGAYVENHNLKKTVVRSRQFVRKYPAELLVVAAGVGFAAAVALQRMTHVCKKTA